MSSLKDLASLIMIPSLVKDGRLDTVKPLGNGIIHPDATGNNDGTDGSTPSEGNFTFSRGSNLAATRVDVNGLIEKGRENQFLYSNVFNNVAWRTNGSASGGQIDRNGSTNAWIVSSVLGSALIGYQTITLAGVHTFSIYVKINNSNGLGIGFGSLSNAARFDISDATKTGAVTETGLISSSQEYVGNNFYHLSVTANMSGSTQMRMYLTTADGTASDAQGGAQIVQDAQLEQSLVATDYIETGASTAQSGILEDLPRLDYSGGASCPSLKLEPQRTNRVTDSEYLNGTWSENRSTLIVNDDTSPEGVNNATKLQEDTTASNTHFTGKGYSYVSGTTYSWSVYAKADGRDEIAIQQGNPSVVSFNAVFNFTSETAANFGNGTARIEDAGNGWYRCIIEGTTALLSSGTNINVFLRSGNSTTYTGDGTSGVLLYGFQLEAGSYPTSYIPTYGSAVTRSQDYVGVVDVSSLGVTTGYTVFYDLDTSTLDPTTWLIQRDASGDYLWQQYGNTAILNTASGGVYPFNLVSGRNKAAIAFDGTNITTFLNGIKVGTFVAASAWNTFGILNLNNNPTKVNWKQLLVFPTALTDSECIALTS